jgi:hypothetical protein
MHACTHACTNLLNIFEMLNHDCHPVFGVFDIIVDDFNTLVLLFDISIDLADSAKAVVPACLKSYGGRANHFA